MIIEKESVTPSGMLNDMGRNRGKERSLKALTEPPKVIQVMFGFGGLCFSYLHVFALHLSYLTFFTLRRDCCRFCSQNHRITEQ